MASEGSPSADTPALDGTTYAAGLNALKDFTDQLTALERIRDSKAGFATSLAKSRANLLPSFTAPIPLILNMHVDKRL
jgi:hypothetical protein